MKDHISILRKAFFQLPLRETFNFFLYQIQLKLGIYQFRTPAKPKNIISDENAFLPQWLPFWKRDDFPSGQISHPSTLIERADKITTGKINYFGVVEKDLDLFIHTPLRHWSRQHSRHANDEKCDIKFIWEPARFAWAIQIGQAYLLTEDEKYPAFFWDAFAAFCEQNPLNMGPNWESAQEVALRLIALVISVHLFNQALPEGQIRAICQSIADHADRILPTLPYAKAQNNNHIISEAVGLFTAGCFLGQHPHSEKWLLKGKEIFENAIVKQIDKNGEYIQHSTNYHRMMLTLSIWMKQLLSFRKESLNAESETRLQKASLWLINLLDRPSGQVPNLGHNDGSLFLPFSTCAYSDYRPIIQAASICFLDRLEFEAGDQDDLVYWLGLYNSIDAGNEMLPTIEVPRIGNEESWAMLRANRYSSRPAHADQLHVDLWYQGVNVLLDPGTFSYNAPPPWDNALASTRVHNTISIAWEDQMTRASRFLWVDWSQAHIAAKSANRISAAHDGYLPFGCIHERQLSMVSPVHWKIVDKLYKLKAAKDKMDIRLHWLLPDWQFDHRELQASFLAPFGKVQFVHQTKSQNTSLTFFKGGKPIFPAPFSEEILGWYSPSYGVKLPAVSMLLQVNEKLPLEITTEIIFEPIKQ